MCGNPPFTLKVALWLWIGGAAVSPTRRAGWVIVITCKKRKKISSSSSTAKHIYFICCSVSKHPGDVQDVEQINAALWKCRGQRMHTGKETGNRTSRREVRQQHRCSGPPLHYTLENPLPPNPLHLWSAGVPLVAMETTACRLLEMHSKQSDCEFRTFPPTRGRKRTFISFMLMHKCAQKLRQFYMHFNLDLGKIISTL